MSRMIIGMLLGLVVTSSLDATDVDKFRPGHKPFQAPKAPLPNGVFAADTCFGFHATRWTPWHGACHDSGAMAPPIGQSCTNKAIILFEEPSAVKSAQPSRMLPAPEASKPMPPPKK